MSDIQEERRERDRLFTECERLKVEVNGIVLQRDAALETKDRWKKRAEAAELQIDDIKKRVKDLIEEPSDGDEYFDFVKDLYREMKVKDFAEFRICEKCGQDRGPNPHICTQCEKAEGIR